MALLTLELGQKFLASEINLLDRTYTVSNRSTPLSTNSTERTFFHTTIVLAIDLRIPNVDDAHVKIAVVILPKFRRNLYL